MFSAVFMINHSAFAFGGEGHFEKVDYGNKPFESAEPVKIKSGKVIFPPNHIFDPEANKVTEVKDKTFFDGILLEDGRIFHVEAILQHPCESMIEIIDESHGSTIHQWSRNKIIKMLRDSGVEIPKDYRYWDIEDKERFFLPYLKKNPELYKEYKEALDLYEKSMYGIISDPETGKFEYTKGKMNVRRNGAYKILLDDGKILLIGGRKAGKDGSSIGSAQEIEIFNPKTGKFNLVNAFNGEVASVIKISDNKIIIIVGHNDYYTYNSKTNTLIEKGAFLQDGRWNSYRKSALKINDKILIFLGRNVSAYNLKSTSFEKNIGVLQFSRSNDFTCPSVSVLLKDGRVLIYGGVKSTDIFGYNYPTKTAEVFDLKTGKSKRTENMNYERKHSSAILLDDGRVLIYGYPAYYKDRGSIYRDISMIELYVSKEYRK